MHTIRSLKNKTITAVLIIAVTLSFLAGAFAFTRFSAKADVEDTKEFQATSLGLTNTDFESTSGTYPASPSGWTGANLDGGKGSVVAGVVDLSASAYFGSESGNKKFELAQYPEYKDEKSMPQTIFGEGSRFEGSDAKTLLVNTKEGAEAAYGYTSGDMTFAANGFYRVSAWVKTGNFAADTGATIKLTGLGADCSFLNINTVENITTIDGIPELNKDNDYGWDKYSFYVRTSASLSKTVKLVLGVGNGGDAEDETPSVPSRPAKGYAFFDHITAERITAHDFATETARFEKASGRDDLYVGGNGTSLALNLYDTASYTTPDGKEIGTFSQNEENWKFNVPYDEYADDVTHQGFANGFVYDSQNIIDIDSDENVYGLTQNPWAPLGQAEYSGVTNPMIEGNDYAGILMISTNDGDEFKDGAYGVASPEVTIERFKYYRFSVWVKGDGVEGGNGISVLVKGKRKDAQNYAKLTEYTSLAGDSADAEHYGWKEQVIYIQGSMLIDYNVRFELWLGAPDAMSKGVAMFDNVTFTELKYSDYSAMSAADSGNVYTIDQNSSDTGVTNGNFMTVGDYEDLEFPLPVASWTYYTPDTVTVNGSYSKEKVNTDHAVHGILPTDKELFDKISAAGDIPGVSNPGNLMNDVYSTLLLSSTTPTAFCYQSSSITLTASTAYKLTVSLAVDGVTEGKGAALVLKTTDGDVVSTIENIGNTNRMFKDYTFYIAAPLSDKSVFVEVWLGLNDSKDNKSKLSNGNVYVRRVASDTWTAADDSTTVESEFADILAKYKTDTSNKNKLDTLNYGVYSFSAPSIDYYDFYSYNTNSGLGVPYQWTASSLNGSAKTGLVNLDNMKDIELYSGFEKKDLTGNMLYIFNTAEDNTRYTYDNTLTLAANKYYRLDIPVKVRVENDVRTDSKHIGANIKLTNTTAEFKNIKDTTTLLSQNNEDSRDYETFKTYTFYISTGENGGDMGLEITFGGEDRESYIQGKLLVGAMTMTEIDNVEYETAEQDTSNAYSLAVALSDAADDDTDTDTEAQPTEIQWWIIPTVIFGAALIAVIIIIFVVRLRDKIKEKKKKNTVYASEYDRADAMRDIERLQALKDADAKPDNAPETPADDEYVYDDEVVKSADVKKAEDAQAEKTQDETPDEEAQAPADDNTAEEPVEKKDAPETAKKAPDASDDLND